MATTASEDELSLVPSTRQPREKRKTKKQLQKEKEEAERLALLEAMKCSDDELQEPEEIQCIKHGNKRQRHNHGMKYTMYAVKFSPDGKTLATSSSDKSVALWDIKTGKELANYEHADYVRSVTFSPDGKELCTGCDDKDARTWKVQERTDLITEAEVLRHFKHRDWVVSTSYSPDAKMLCTVSRMAEVLIHDLLWDRRLASKERRRSTKHRDGSKERAGSKSSPERSGSKGGDGERDASKERSGSKERDGERDGSKQTTDSKDEKREGSKRRASSKTPIEPVPRKLHHEDQTYDACFSADSELLVTASGWDRGYAIIFDIASLDEVLRIPQPDWVTSVSLGPMTSGLPLILTTSRDKTARVWELPEQMLYGQALQDSKDEKERREQERKEAEAGKKKLVMSKKKQKELAEAAEREALLSKLSATEVLKLEHLGRSICAAFSPDGKRICTGCDTGYMLITDLATKEQLTRIDQEERIMCVEWSASGRKICVGSEDASARVYGGLRNLWMKESDDSKK